MKKELYVNKIWWLILIPKVNKNRREKNALCLLQFKKLHEK